MRFSVFIAVLATAALVEGAVRFGPARDFPDVGLAWPVFQEAEPDPAEMPRAAAYLVTDPKSGTRELEDRFDQADLWQTFSLRGRWRDADGNYLSVFRLAARAPDAAEDATFTRTAFYSRLRPLEVKSKTQLDAAVAFAVAPLEVGRPMPSRRSRRKNLENLLFYPVTNAGVTVCAFLPKARPREAQSDWHLAVFAAAPTEDADDAFARFDADFLDAVRTLPGYGPDAALEKRKTPLAEEALLRRDVRRNVVNYANWQATDAADAVVLDDLDAVRADAFLSMLTNDLPRLRAAYQRLVPAPLDGTNALAVVRVFADRGEFLGFEGTLEDWMGAYWCPSRRELVMHFDGRGAEALMATVRHEAFHQYASYACAMMETAPWFNEGHAQLFEYSHFTRAGELVFDRDPEAAAWIQARAEKLAGLLPLFLLYDYEAFYAADGTDAERLANYRLAWSIAYFLEVGAPEVRFQPFRNLRADYARAVVDERDATRATRKVFTSDLLSAFVAEWRKFWKAQ